jgi:hypothetical protein
MRIYVNLVLLIASAVVLPGGFLLLPLAYAKYRSMGQSRAKADGPDLRG